MIPESVYVAKEILDMYGELEKLRKEVKVLREYKEKYNALLDSSISHSHTMMGHLVTSMLKEPKP